MAHGEFVRPLPDVRWVDAGDPTVQLDGPLIYRDDEGTEWHVRSGFQTDFASVPRWIPGLFRLAFRGALETAHAAILHDWLYYTAAAGTRARSDALFYEALRATGESWLGANALWAGVRAGGWFGWRRRRAKAVARRLP